MKNKSIIALSVSVLTGTSLLLALVFSPLRGYYSDSTTLLDKTKAISGVDLNGKIKNARDSKTYQMLSDNSLNIPGNATSTKKVSGRNGSGVSTSDNSVNTPAMYYVINPVGNGSNGLGHENFTSVSKQQVNNVSGNALGLLTTASLSNPANRTATATKPGFISTTADLTLSSQAGPKYNADAPPPDSKNGDNPPTPPNLPIGNGIHFMLILAVVFATWKIKKTFS
jgi:hypothetical protein